MRLCKVCEEFWSALQKPFGVTSQVGKVTPMNKVSVVTSTFLSQQVSSAW